MKLQDIDRSFCEVRSRQGASRSRLTDLVHSALGQAEPSDAQQRALEVLKNPASVVAITGQQVGLFGGPMYTAYKIRSTAHAAAMITAQTGAACVPMFWIEDNDHDAGEAMTAHLLQSSHDIVTLKPWDGSDPRQRVSSRTIDHATQDSIHGALHTLQGRYADATMQRMQDIYASGASWSEAFLAVLAPYLSRWGVLPIRASQIVDAGLHGPVLQHLLTLNSTIVASMRSTSDAIVERGGHIQASIPDIPWMYTTSSGRQRIEKTDNGVRFGDEQLSHDELCERAKRTPELFTPTVLTRPMVQDAVLPTVVSILGAAELSYHHQLPDAYSCAGLVMPALQQRSGMTLITAKTHRNITKSGHDLSWFQRPWQQIEHDITSELTDDLMPEKNVQRQFIDSALRPYLEAAERIDATLIATVHAQRAGMEASLDTLEGKLRSAAKKKNAVTLERAHAVHAHVFPSDVLQERWYPLAMWESMFGIDELASLCDAIAEHDLGTHIITQASHNEPTS